MRKTNQRFVGDFMMRVNEYLPGSAASCHQNSAGDSPALVPECGILPDEFHLFDSATMQALSHAIEDTAMDMAEGRLLASYQDFSNFATHREKYSAMAGAIDQVTVIGCGKKPRANGLVRFASVRKTVLCRFWIVLYQGKRSQMALISRQCNDADDIDEKLFTGFYTFDSKLTTRLETEIVSILEGRSSAMSSFETMESLDLASKQIQTAFSQEKEILASCFRQWKGAAGIRYSPEQLIQTLDKSLLRLAQLKASLNHFHVADLPSSR